MRAATDKERGDFGLVGVVVTQPEVVVANHVGHDVVKFVEGDPGDVESFDA